MKRNDVPPSPTRPYRQTARAEAAEATGRRIIQAFSDLLHSQWYDQVTLEEVARLARVTVRTVIRRFGGKDGLLEAFVEQFVPSAAVSRDTPPGDVDAAVGRAAKVYEVFGDSVVRNRAQEQRHAALKRLLDRDRAGHRMATAQAYAPWLERLAEPERRRVLDALVVATDVYTWKVVRRDMGRSRDETAILLRLLVDAVLGRASALASNAGSRP